MTEYISKQAFKEKYLCCGWLPEMSEEEFDAFPAADVAPVRHGRWTPTDYTGDCCYTCSECGFERDAYLLDIGNFCPNCGARMDENETD